ncbi:MAG: SPOR domain-containing protein [Uliginosibacterium sp.]|jgi:DedD protein|nr:SPOR domain-containing protein [Uliginosibacterium sp.]
MADSDPQQELKKRARRRLVGALAMALAAAIILPMVMDGEPPQQVGSDLQIKIPSQEGSNFTSRAIKPPASPALAASQPVVSQSETSSPIVDASGVESPLVLKADEPVPVDTAAETKPKAAVTPTPKGATSESPSSKKADAKPRDDARARAILEDRPAAAVQGDKAEVFYVQLGLYRDAANARDVQTKAAAHGVKSSLLRIGNNTRVRAGPFADRAAADGLVAKLKQAGLSGFVATK